MKIDDVLLGQAIDLVRATRNASTAHLQRKLIIGYNRAHQISMELERRGIISGYQGLGIPRKVFDEQPTGQAINLKGANQ